MNTIFPIVMLTFREGVRHRIIFGAAVASLLLVFLSIFFCGLFMRDLLKVLADICLAAISISGLLIPIFFSINQFSADIEKKTIYSILSRPISRSQYIIGRFLGLSMLALVIMSFLLGSTVISIFLAKLLYPENIFANLSLQAISMATLTSFFSVVLLNASATLWCCLTTSSFLATLLTLSTYVIGHSIEDLVRFVESQGHLIHITPFTKIFLTVLMYIFPNLAAFDKKQLAAHGIAIPATEFVLLLTYSTAYCIALLFIAIHFFKKRDL